MRYKVLYLLIILVLVVLNFQCSDLERQYPPDEARLENLRNVCAVSEDTAIVVGSEGSIIKTCDGGTTWKSKADSISGFLESVFFVNQKEGWVVGDQGLVLKTVDGGENWQPILTDNSYNFNSVYFLDEKNGYLVGDEGLILTTHDSAKTWHPANLDIGNIYEIECNQNASCWLVGDLTSVIYLKEKIDKKLLTMQKWTEERAGVLTDVSFVNDSVGWAVGAGIGTKIIHTNDFGKNWVAQRRWRASGLMSVHFINSDTGWAVGKSGEIQFTKNGGKDWDRKVNITSQDLISMDIAGSSCWMVGHHGTIVKMDISKYR